MSIIFISLFNDTFILRKKAIRAIVGKSKCYWEARGAAVSRVILMRRQWDTPIRSFAFRARTRRRFGFVCLSLSWINGALLDNWLHAGVTRWAATPNYFTASASGFGGTRRDRCLYIIHRLRAGFYHPTDYYYYRCWTWLRAKWDFDRHRERCKVTGAGFYVGFPYACLRICIAKVNLKRNFLSYV